MAGHHDLIERSRLLLAAAHDRTGALRQQLVRASSRLSATRQLLARIEAVSALRYFAAAPPPPPVRSAAEATRTFAAVTELIQQIEHSAAGDGEAMTRLIGDIKCAIQTESDPWLLMGVLLEGIVQTALERLPAREQQQTRVALLTLLWDRIKPHRPEPD